MSEEITKYLQELIVKLEEKQQELYRKMYLPYLMKTRCMIGICPTENLTEEEIQRDQQRKMREFMKLDKEMTQLIVVIAYLKQLLAGK